MNSNIKQIEEQLASGEIVLDKKGHFYQYFSRWTMHAIAEQIYFQQKFPDVEDDYSRVQCYHCGKDIRFKATTTGYQATQACPYPNGFPPIQFTLNVPSGKLVVANDLREEFRIIGSYNINALQGIKQTSQHYAKTGLAHGFVSNTCPAVYRINNHTFSIGNKPPQKGARIVANICTDLWWYSIADYDEFVRRTGRQPSNQKYDEQIINCQPGTYLFNDSFHLLDENKIGTFSTFHRTGEPTKLKNFKQQFEQLNFTAEQVFHFLFRKHPDFYGNPEQSDWLETRHGKMVRNYFCDQGVDPQKEYPFYTVTDRLLAVIGGGYEWHPNGWCCDDPTIPINEPEIQIPLLNKPHQWYPVEEDFSAISKIAEGKIHVNPSFANLAYNMLQCVIRHGAQNRRNSGRNYNPFPKKLARKLFNQMKKQYPVPDFAQNLTKTK